MPSFSVALIAKNEANSLPRLIQSLSEFQKRGGEIVLTDTGSTDDTANVARSLGCTVFEEGERFLSSITEDMATKINQLFVDEEMNIVSPGDKLFDYSAARNYAASKASNDMIIMGDCDEAYTALNLDVIEETIKAGVEQIEYQFVFSHDANGKPAIQFRQCKFYNRKKLKWRGIVHEVLEGAASRGYLGEDIIKLEHWQAPQEHRSRYLAGLALDCYLNQTNDRNSHYLGRELVWTGRPKSAIKELTRHIAMNGWLSERAQSMIFIGDAYLNLGKETEALDSYNKSFLADSSRREALMRLAQFFYKKNDYQKTACYCAAAMEIPWGDFYANHMANYTYEPHELMYWATWYLGDKEKSKKHYDLAASYFPNNPKYINDRQFYYPNEQNPTTFEYKDQGIDGWMTPGELNWLYEQAKKANSILELGSWKGRSSHALLSGCKGKVTCVDTFQGSADPQDLTNDLAKKTDVYSEFMKNVGSFENLEVLRMTGTEAAALCKDRKFDLIFIDAGHTYEEVKRDIEDWKDKTVILSGHDYCHAWLGVGQAVNDCLGEVALCESIWYKSIEKTKELEFKDFPQDTHPERLYALKHINSDDEVILDLGCGSHKTSNEVIGVDIRPVTDITASIDVIPMERNTVDLIISRHSFEHLLDPVKVLNEWHRVLRLGGKIVFVLPDQDYINTVNPFYSNNEHMHAYTRESLKNLIGLFSFKVLSSETVVPDWSFGLVAEKVNPTERNTVNIGQLQSLIEKEEPFAFVKHGDGEDACMSGSVGGNCDGHPYSPELANKLKAAFSFFNTKDNIHTVLFDDQETYNILLHRIDSNLSNLKSFCSSIRNSSRKKVFIGPMHLMLVAAMLKANYIYVPKVNAFEKYDEIVEKLKGSLQDNGIYMFSAGMPAKPMIAEAIQANPTITCLDFGSSFDPLFIDQTRTFQAPQSVLKDLYSEFLPTIPKRIFTIWLNDDNKIPENIAKCIASQKAIPGYEHNIITLDNYPKGIPYVEDAIKAKKWVKAADYLRMNELINNGGIHCDADMEILPGKNFDDLLHFSLFIASEVSRFANGSLLGCIPDHPIIKAHLEEMVQKFKGDDDKFIESSIEILTPMVYAGREENKSVRILEPEYFIPYDHMTGTIKVTPKTRGFHHFMKSWADAPDLLPKVSILLPTLGREDGLKRCLESIDRLYYPKHLIEVLIDDNESRTVPSKVNRLYSRANGDVMVFAANDIEFTPGSVYSAIKESNGHGLMAFNTGEVYQDEGNICEHFLIWRDTIKKIGGEIFSERFHHVGCDNLLWAKCKKLGEASRCEAAKVTHYHFSKGSGVVDNVITKGWAHTEEDRETLAEELDKMAI